MPNALFLGLVMAGTVFFALVQYFLARQSLVLGFLLPLVAIIAAVFIDWVFVFSALVFIAISAYSVVMRRRQKK